jgi:REP element-mobilizing transposase RayT
MSEVILLPTKNPSTRTRATKAAKDVDYDFVVPRPVMTAHAGSSLVVHLAWATKGFDPILAVSTDGSLAAALRATARELACHVIAVGNTADEVHVIVRYPATVCVSELTHLLKAATSEAWNRRGNKLEWHPGYWAKTCDTDRLAALVEYVRALTPHDHEDVQAATG